MRGIVYRLRGDIQIASAHQLNEPVAQVLALKEHHDRKHDRDAAHAQGAQHWAKDVTHDLEGGRLGWLHFDRNGFRLVARGWQSRRLAGFPRLKLALEFL